MPRWGGTRVAGGPGSRVAVELALAHTVGTKVKRAYVRTDLFDKRRTLMDAWAAFCLGEETGGNVVEFKMKEA
jgi:hypothetical protein